MFLSYPASTEILLTFLNPLSPFFPEAYRLLAPLENHKRLKASVTELLIAISGDASIHAPNSKRSRANQLTPLESVFTQIALATPLESVFRISVGGGGTLAIFFLRQHNKATSTFGTLDTGARHA